MRSNIEMMWRCDVSTGRHQQHGLHFDAEMTGASRSHGQRLGAQRLEEAGVRTTYENKAESKGRDLPEALGR
jgi:hypothetical protein